MCAYMSLLPNMYACVHVSITQYSYTHPAHTCTHTGRHCFNDARFKFDRSIPVSSENIKFSTLTMFKVNAGDIGLAWNDHTAELYNAGHYLRNNANFRFVGTRSVLDAQIQHGPITLFRVYEGELGLAYEGANPVVYPPGYYNKDSRDFRLERMADMKDKLIAFGPIKIITVDAGEVCCCYNNGVLEILTEGRYVKNSGTFVLGRRVSLRQFTLNFEKHKVLAQGGVYMIIEGLLTFQIMDANKYIMELGDAVDIHQVSTLMRCMCICVYECQCMRVCLRQLCVI
jgi:hypothetical protein